MSRPQYRPLSCVAAILLLVSSTAVGGEENASAQSEAGVAYFEKQIRPLLVNHCYGCHSEIAEQREGGLVLDARQGWLLGGDSGPAVVPGDVEASLLIQAVRYGDTALQMPPVKPLDAEELVGLGHGGNELDEAYEQYWRDRPKLAEQKQQAEAALQLIKTGDDAGLQALAEKHASAVAEDAKVVAKPAETRTSAQQSLIDKLTKSSNEPPAIPPRAMIPNDVDQPADEHVRVAGQFNQLGDPVARGFLSVLSDAAGHSISPGESGRIALGQWLTDSDQRSGQLAARVMANRVWHHLLGRGLVRTVDNFGRTGEPPSHPKPILNELDGKPLSPAAVGSDRGHLGNLLGSPFAFSQHGESGIWISELLPHLSRHADRLCVVRSMHTEGSAHGEALLRLHTGQANLVRPSVGAWVSYGLGSENDNLPAFITISPPRGHGGVQNYGSAFLPAIHQGTAVGSAETPVKNARVSHVENARLDRDTQRHQLDLIQSLNHQHLETAESDQGIEALIANYELAFRMQSAIPQVMNLNDETQETLDLYGVNQEPTDNFGRQCLLARKFAESGVRYIQISTDYTWDHHQKLQTGIVGESAKVDRPIAGLLTDLAQRGLLEETLIVWGAEFGRTPMAENVDGRNHHPQAFTMWLAGGGVRGGLTYGATDEFGYRPVENPVHMHDLHASLLYALGMDHKRLTYRHAGREFRLTDVHGNVVESLWS